MITPFILFVTLATLSTADGVLTHDVLSRGGVESNPVMALVWHTGGVYGLGAVKIAIGALVGYWQLDGTLPDWGIAICIAIYGFTVLHLRRELRKMGPRHGTEHLAR